MISRIAIVSIMLDLYRVSIYNDLIIVMKKMTDINKHPIILYFVIIAFSNSYLLSPSCLSSFV